MRVGAAGVIYEAPGQRPKAAASFNAPPPQLILPLLPPHLAGPPPPAMPPLPFPNMHLPPPSSSASAQQLSQLASAAAVCSKSEWDAKINAFLARTTRVYNPGGNVDPPRPAESNSQRRSPSAPGVRGLGPKPKVAAIRRPRSPGDSLDAYYEGRSLNGGRGRHRAISPPSPGPPRRKRKDEPLGGGVGEERLESPQEVGLIQVYSNSL